MTGAAVEALPVASRSGTTDVPGLARSMADEIDRQMTEQVYAAHRHTPDKATVLSERYVMGIRWVTVPCSVCGEPLPERQL